MGDHHYIMGHRIYPKLFFDHGVRFINDIKDDKLKLRKIWEDIGERLEYEMDNSNGLNIVEIKGIGVIGIIIIYPRTEIVAECIMSASIIEKEKKFGIIPYNKKRYITLEFGVNDDLHPRSVLCEWHRNGSRSNYGDGCGFGIDDFVNDLYRLIKKNVTIK